MSREKQTESGNELVVSFCSLSVEVHACDVFLFNLRCPSGTVVLVLLCIEWKHKSARGQSCLVFQ